MRIEWGLSSEDLRELLQDRYGVQGLVDLVGAEYDELADLVALNIELSLDDYRRMLDNGPLIGDIVV